MDLWDRRLSQLHWAWEWNTICCTGKPFQWQFQEVFGELLQFLWDEIYFTAAKGKSATPYWSWSLFGASAVANFSGYSKVLLGYWMGKWEYVLFRWTDGNRMIYSVHFSLCGQKIITLATACLFTLCSQLERVRTLWLRDAEFCIFLSRSTWTSCLPSATVSLWNWTLDSCDSYYVHFVETKGNEKDKNKTAENITLWHVMIVTWQ